MSDHFTITEQPDPLAKLPALAKRLGVEPTTDAPAATIVQMRDGTRYDLFALLNAVLNRLDKAIP